MKILIVEDDLYFRKNIKRELSQYGEVHDSANLPLALDLLDQHSFDIAFIDLNLTENLNSYEGLQIVKKCSSKNVVSVVLTGHEEKSVIAEAYSMGCHHYFSKLDFEMNIHERVGPLLQSSNENELQDFFRKEFITRDESLISKIKFIKEQAINFDQNILITGPTGVGKTKIAKLIHQFYDPKRPFVHINLSELPENLIESELFGHKKGSFTGANSDKKGLLEEADGGVLFLDEIGTIPLNIQKKLLKVIEEKTFTPVGSVSPKKSDFKLITATCDDLSNKINEGEFRVDFYFRIKGNEIDIPSLKNRRKDIFAIIDSIISKSPKKIAFETEAEVALIKYDWFGNVRELENVTKELISKANGIIKLSDLPSHIIENISPFAKPVNNDEQGFLNSKMRTIIKEEGLPALVKLIEHQAFDEMIIETKGKINEAARRLKISKTLLYRIQKEKQAQHTLERN